MWHYQEIVEERSPFCIESIRRKRHTQGLPSSDRFVPSRFYKFVAGARLRHRAPMFFLGRILPGLRTWSRAMPDGMRSAIVIDPSSFGMKSMPALAAAMASHLRYEYRLLRSEFM
jgi:hypothetical protein